MIEKDRIFNEMQELWDLFVEEHNKTTAVASRKARGYISDLKKMVTDYRKASTARDAEIKEIKKQTK